ncbi:MAG: MlaD family protein [Tepidisphaeraceae bacterium]|jgi:ABC-type transporter Mla subunit MlaD
MAKTKQRNAFRAGVFMIISIALVVAVVIAISGTSRFTQHFNNFVVRFSLGDDIGGLQVGDDVRLGGLKVGSIRKISVSSDDNSIPGVDVKIELPAEYTLRSDARILVQKGLTGAADINITSLGTGQTLLAGASLIGQPDQFAVLEANLAVASGKLNIDLDKLGQTADSFTDTGHAATATVQDVHTRIPQIHQRFNDLIAAAIQMLDAVRDFIGPSSGDFHTTLANLSALTKSTKDKVPDILDELHDGLAKVDTALTHVNNAMIDVEATAVHAKDLTGGLASLIQDNRSKLDGIITSLKAASDNLKYATVEIRHSPWRLLYQPKAGEMNNLNIYDSVRQFAEGADSLDDAAGALKDALADKNADPAQVKKLMAQLNDSFARFQEVQQKLWTEIKN